MQARGSDMVQEGPEPAETAILLVGGGAAQEGLERTSAGAEPRQPDGQTTVGWQHTHAMHVCMRPCSSRLMHACVRTRQGYGSDQPASRPRS